MNSIVQSLVLCVCIASISCQIGVLPRQFAGGMGSGWGMYDYNDYYGDYTSDYNYDYYDWVCNEDACLLCDVLTSECCDPAIDINCYLPDSCLNSPCLSGGSCVTMKTINGNPDFQCICMPGLTGKYCQQANNFFVGADIIDPLLVPQGFGPPPLNTFGQGRLGSPVQSFGPGGPGFGPGGPGFGEQNQGYGQQQQGYGQNQGYGQQQQGYGQNQGYGQQQQGFNQGFNNQNQGYGQQQQGYGQQQGGNVHQEEREENTFGQAKPVEEAEIEDQIRRSVQVQPTLQSVPVVQTPVIQTPVIQTPVVQTPVVQTPVVQTPVIQQQQPIVQNTVTQQKKPVQFNTMTQQQQTHQATAQLPMHRSTFANKLNVNGNMNNKNMRQ